MKIDRYELETQRKKEILNGNYMRCEIIIPRAEIDTKITAPYVNIENHNSNILMRAMMLQSLKVISKQLEEEEPALKLIMEKYFTVTDHSEIHQGDMLDIED